MTMNESTDHVDPTILLATTDQVVGERIALILSRNSYRMEAIEPSPLTLISFQTTFQGQTCKARLVCGFSHLVQVQFSTPFLDWNATSEHELFSAVIVRNEKTELSDAIRRIAAQVSHIVLCFESDLEGEYFGGQLLDLLFEVPAESHRMKFASLAEHHVTEAFQNLISWNQHKALCVTLRQDIDLRVGAAMTRFIQLRLKPWNNVLDKCNELLSFGPDSAPLLYLIVQQHHEVQRHNTNERLRATAMTQSNDQILCFDWNQNNQLIVTGGVNETSEFEHKREKLERLGAGRAVVSNVTVRQRCLKAPPRPLDTMSLLKLASQELQYSPTETIDLAMKLYHDGFITYPRTHASSHSSKQDWDILKDLEKCIEFQALVYELRADNARLTSITNKSSTSKTVGKLRTLPITPVRLANKVELSHRAWSLYELICRYFIISLMDPLVYDEATVEIEYQDELFTWTGCKVQQYGYAFRVPNQTPKMCEYPDALPNVGDHIFVQSILIKSVPKPKPRLLSEAELLESLKELGIGRFTINLPSALQQLCDCKMVELVEDRRLRPTDVGLELIRIFEDDAPGLVRPDVRKQLEDKLPLISRDELSYREAAYEMIEMYKSMFSKLKHANYPAVESKQPSLTTKSPTTKDTAPVASISGTLAMDWYDQGPKQSSIWSPKSKPSVINTPPAKSTSDIWNLKRKLDVDELNTNPKKIASDTWTPIPNGIESDKLNEDVTTSDAWNSVLNASDSWDALPNASDLKSTDANTSIDPFAVEGTNATPSFNSSSDWALKKTNSWNGWTDPNNNFSGWSNSNRSSSYPSRGGRGRGRGRGGSYDSNSNPYKWSKKSNNNNHHNYQQSRSYNQYGGSQQRTYQRN